jgi:Ca2+-binding RTX toxin-like protein
VLATEQAATFVNGNQVTATATFTRADGTTGTVADVSYQVDNIHTEYTGAPITVTAQAAALPEHRAYGTLVSLREAMSLDTDFADTVEDTLPLLSSLDLEGLRNAAIPILIGWATTSPLGDGDRDPNTSAPPLESHDDVHLLVARDAFGKEEVLDFAYEASVTVLDENGQPEVVHFWALASGGLVRDQEGTVIEHPTLQQVLDAPQVRGSWTQLYGEHIAFVERYLGESLPVDLSPEETTNLSTAIPVFTSILNTIDLIVVRIATQDGPLAPYFEGIVYDAEDNNFHAATDRELIPVFEAIFAQAQATGATASWLAQWKPILDIVIGDYVRGATHLINTYGFLAQNIVAAYESTDLSLPFRAVTTAMGIPDDLVFTGTGTLTGSDDADIFYGTAGDEVFRGGRGPDTYIFGEHIGHDTIDDIEPALEEHVPDLIRFAHLNPDDITATRDGVDLILTVNATGETITVVRQFEGVKPSFTTGDISEDNGVGEIIFADGTVWDAVDIAQAVSHPQATDDTLIGTPSVDFLDGGLGTDHMTGGDDSDLYSFGRGYGQDTIKEGKTNVLVQQPDFVVFGPDITQDDITFHRDGNAIDLQIEIAGTTDTLTVIGQFDASYTIFGLEWFDGIELFTFRDGSYFTAEQIMELLVAAAGTNGDDMIYGFAYEDLLDGGLGTDFLSGGNENDTYVFGSGYGADVIYEGATNILGGMTDTLVLNADVMPEDVSFHRDGNSDDLLITLASGDTLVIQGQFQAMASGPFGTLWFNRVERIEFDATGDVLTADNIIGRILTEAKTEGDDEIYGFNREDTLDGGAGNDYLAGGREGDTYHWGRGYGNDVVYDLGDGIPIGLDIDRLVLSADLLPSDLLLSRPNGGDDLILTIADTGETLTLQSQFFKAAIGESYVEMERIEFADGTVWTPNDLRLLTIAAQETTGNDTVYGFHTADVLDGGEGDDLLVGQGGGDTFVFGRGYGHDTVDAYIVYVSRDDADTILFNADVAPGDVLVERSGDDLILTIAGTDDRLTVVDHFASLGAWQVENLSFADGTTWTYQDIQMSLIVGTPGDDELTGFNTNHTLDGGAGNDVLKGRRGNDTYVFGRGYGRDVIDDDNVSLIGDAPDRLVFGPDIVVGDLEFVRVGAEDMVIRILGTDDEVFIRGQYNPPLQISTFELADGTVLTVADVDAIIAQSGPGHVTHRGTVAAETIVGTDAADIIDGRGGNDLLQGGWGFDAYLYGIGSGNDTIAEAGPLGDTDTVKLVGLNAADVSLGRNGADLYITITATGEVLKVAGHFDSGTSGIEQLTFANGTTLDRTAIQNAAIILGTSGADTIDGSDAADIIDGRGGNDLLRGGWGADTYLYGSGSGNDTIAESGPLGDVDTVKLVGLNAADVSLGRNGADLYITITATGEVLKVAGHFDSGTSGIEQLLFANGTTLDRTAIQNAAMILGTSGNDTINGSNLAETFDGLGGNDTINGGGGNDTYRYGPGSGNDIIAETTDGAATDRAVLLGLNPADVTLGRSGADLLVTITASGEVLRVRDHFWGTASGIEQLVFADGTTWDRNRILIEAPIRGTSGNDSLIGSNVEEAFAGGAGNDYLEGRGGNDTYLFNLGDGQDSIWDGAFDPLDTLQFGGGITAQNVTVAQGDFGRDLILTITGTSDRVVLDNRITQVYGGADQVRFADGTVWSYATVMQMSLTPTAANDSFYGDGGANTLAGGLGNDYLEGRDGDDTYLFNLGDGQDFIWDGGSGLDTLQLGSGIATQDVTVRQADFGRDLVVTINGTTDRIVLDSRITSTAGGADQVRFADGTVWDFATLLQLSLVPTAANEEFYGDAGNNTLAGGPGNDYMEGRNGDDTYLFNLGDGQDGIWDGGSGFDTLQFGTGIAPQDIVVTQANFGTDLILTVSGTSDFVLLDNRITQSAGGADQARFADGTTWSYATLLQKSLTPTAGNDTFYGDGDSNIIDTGLGNDGIDARGGNDTLIGGGGNDGMTGGAGNDTFVFHAGFGQDTIADFAAGSGVGDVIEFHDAIFADFAAVLAASQQVGANVRITVDASNSIVLNNVSLANLHQNDFLFV